MRNTELTLEQLNEAGRNSMKPFFIMLGLVCALGLFVVANPLKTNETLTTQAVAASGLPLMFEDGSDGVVVVRHGQTGQVIKIVDGEASFLRNALRSLTLERQRLLIGTSTPFVLHQGSDLRLRLTDPLTNRHIDIAAFGSANGTQFIELFAQFGKPVKS
jgi:putative photosynthetic complex assembly protein